LLAERAFGALAKEDRRLRRRNFGWLRPDEIEERLRV